MAEAAGEVGDTVVALEDPRSRGDEALRETCGVCENKVPRRYTPSNSRIP